MINDIKDQIESAYNIQCKLLEDVNLHNAIREVCEIIIDAYRKGNKLLIAGNGGSAGDAQHMAGELVNKFYFDRPGIPALALTTDTSIITAIGNDYGYDRIFARQIQANAVKGDVFLGISTSGNSVNIVEGVKEAANKGVFTVGLVGEGKCTLDELCDFIIKVPSRETPRIQEAHLLIEHIICEQIEREIFKEKL